MKAVDPWTLYWQADRLHSCLATASEADRRELAEFWRRFGRGLTPGSRLLDLATGNGAVPLYLVQAGLPLEITAVDKARIDPQRYVASHPELAAVHFIGGIDLEDLSCLAGPYDAVTSQFGLEYAPRPCRARAVASLLRAGGRLQLLMHHSASDVVRPRRRDCTELRALLAPEGPVAAARALLDDRIAPAEVERRGRAYLHGAGMKTRRLSGQVLAAIDQLLTALETDDSRWRTLATALYQRLEAEHARLEQLIGAALSEPEIESFAEELTRLGIVVDVCEPLQVGTARGSPALLGWQVRGRRR